MDKAAREKGKWKSRDAWFCVLVLVVLQFTMLLGLRIAARSSPAFDHWWEAPLGTGIIYIIQDALWLFVAFWFSRVQAVRDFLQPSGLRRGVSVLGWCAAWLAIAIAFIDGYGASRGLTASSRRHQPLGYGAFSLAWYYFTLSSVVIAPFCEEVVTRGFLFRALRGRYSFLVTTIIIICFSAYFHRSSGLRSAFTLGCLTSLWVLLCIVRERTRSLWNCLLCHAVYNLVCTHLWIPAIAILILLVPFIMYPIWGRRRDTTTAAPARDA
jgi:membrane protease YdiL (CAAX protease family)